MHRDPALQTLKAGAVASAIVLPLADLGRRTRWFDVDLFRMVGTLLTSHPSRARRLGVPVSLANSLGFAVPYRFAFHLLRVRPSAASGALLGMGHFVLAMSSIAVLSRVHPRAAKASLRPGEPLGTTGRSVAVLFAGHALYGAVLGHLLR